MARGRAFEEIEGNLPAAPVAFGDICLLAIPVQTFKALADEAAKRGLTLAQLLQKAIDGVLTPAEVPRVLVEQESRNR